jgi:hypothetical protein
MSFNEPPLDFDSVPFADEEWLATQRNGDTPERRGEFDSWPEFRSFEEVASEALLGTRSDTILPADGIVLLYGDGGAGKTTLTLDAVVHMADARDWLGLEVARPVSSLVIENEGPRAKFRQIIGEKLDTLNGSDAGERLFILREPWSRFTLADGGLREDVAAIVRERNLDVVVLGPLATVGMVGGGTPDEISRFEGLLRELRALVDRPVAFWIVHHENKSGDVSGAWERVPDTLVHVQGAGNGHTRFVFRKARWSSEYHGRTLNLTWSEGRTFDVVEERERDYYADVLDVFAQDDRWRTSAETAKEAKCRPGEAKSALAELTRRGDLMFEVGPTGRSARAQCWRLRSATVLRLVPETPEAPSPAPPDDDFTF